MVEPPLNTSLLSASDIADRILTGAATVLEVRWHRDNPASKTLLARVRVSQGDVRTIRLPDGSHRAYNVLKPLA